MKFLDSIRDAKILNKEKRHSNFLRFILSASISLNFISVVYIVATKVDDKQEELQQKALEIDKDDYKYSAMPDYSVADSKCEPQPTFYTGIGWMIKKGETAQLKITPIDNRLYAWFEGDKLIGSGVRVYVHPIKTTEYTLLVVTKCGAAASKVRVYVEK